MHIDPTTADELLVVYRLGGLDISGDMFFWESRADGKPHIVITHAESLDSDNLLNTDNDFVRRPQEKSLVWWFQMRWLDSRTAAKEASSVAALLERERLS